MKRLYTLALVLLLVFCLTACGNNNSSGNNSPSTTPFNPVPNIMGVAYSDAKTVLESAGFEVTAIETDASSILPNGSTTYNRAVKKGEVFKVNNTTNPTYSDSKTYPIAPDKKVFIYYAKEDYVAEKTVAATTAPATTAPATTAPATTAPATTAPATTALATTAPATTAPELGENKVSIPFSYSDLEKKNYKEVIQRLEDVGFTNIGTVK